MVMADVVDRTGLWRERGWKLCRHINTHLQVDRVEWEALIACKALIVR